MKTILKIILLSTIFISCEEKEDIIYKTDKFELRQLVKNVEKNKVTHGAFFLIAGTINQYEETTTTVKVFAKVDGRYRLLEMPIKDIRIQIDNNLKIPNIEIEYYTREKLTNEYVINRGWIEKVYIINCSEKYLPEKLLPINL